MNTREEQSVRAVFERHPEVGVAYLFGSRARGTHGPTSDYDFAVYADLHDKEQLSNLTLALRGELAQALATDAIDLVMLNTTASPELKYAIIQEGVVLFERGSYRIRIEPPILNTYFDFRAMLRRYQLTRA